MAYIKDMEIFALLKKEPPKRTYMLYGAEKYLLNKAVSLLKKKTVKGFEEFNFTVLEGDLCTVEDIEIAVETFPMMADRKCVLVKDLNLDKLNAADYNRLKKILTDPPETCVIIFSMVNLDINLNKAGKSSKLKTIAELISKEGYVSEFPYKTRREICKYISETAAKRGSHINAENSGYLADICAAGLDEISKEVDKLCSYAGENEIKKEDIDALVPKKTDVSVFDIAKSVLNGNSERALTILDGLFYQRAEPVAILGALAMTFIDIYRAKCAVISGRGIPELTESFNYRGKEFRVRNAEREASGLDERQLAGCLNILQKTDMQLKGTRADNRLILEKAIISMVCATA